MSRSNPFFVFLGVAICLWGGAAVASNAKIKLFQDVVVNGSSIYLSDLLPKSSPESVRTVAQEMLIGSSPQPGGVRILSSDEITRILDGENLLSQVAVPEQVVVHRSGHLVTREEVAEAIQTLLRRNQANGSVQIEPQSIRLAAHVVTSMQDSRLRVTRIESDRALHEMKFWLVSDAEPTLQPFMATIPEHCVACGAAETTRAVSAQPGGSGDKSRSNGEPQTAINVATHLSNSESASPANRTPAVVEAGKMVRLHMVSGDGTQMYLNAISLERGALGQSVRVKIQETGKILQAHVVGRGQLEAEF